MLGISGVFARLGTEVGVTGLSRVTSLGLFVVAQGKGGLIWVVGSRCSGRTGLGPTWTAVGTSTLSLIEKVKALSQPDI